MPVYTYLARDLQGVDHKGDIETNDVSQAAMLLRRKKLVVIKIVPLVENKNSLAKLLLDRVSFESVVIITRQLATMVGAGLVLSEAVDVLSEQQDNKRLKQALEDISRDIKGGIDFASAVKKHADIFPPIYSNLIKAGQASGKLDIILNNLADNMEKQRDFQSKVKGAMVYPVVIVVMMFGVMLVMVFFVIPKLMGLYTESGMELPLTTRLMLGFSNIMISYWPIILIIVIGTVIGIKRYIDTPGGRLGFDTYILKAPIAGRIVKLVALANFTRTFSLLTSAGLPILDAIKIVADVVGNLAYKNSLDLVYRAVERGLPLSEQLIAMPLFPKIVGQMAKTGEETGKLDIIFLKLAEYFESETDNSLKNMTTLIEPIVLVVLGIGVAFLVLSIIMPIYQLTTNIK